MSSSVINFSENIISKKNISLYLNPYSRIEMEIEALQSIYSDNMRRVTSKYEGDYEIYIKLLPNLETNLSIKPFCYIELNIKYPNDYPSIAPIIKFSYQDNIKNDELTILKQKIDLIIEEYQNKNMEMVHEICQFVQGFLDDKNRNFESIKKGTKNITASRKNSDEERQRKKLNDNYDYLKRLFKIDNDLKRQTTTNLIIDDSELCINNLGDINNNSSRFLTDFEVIEKIGQGDGGCAYKVKNKYDGMYYAIKRVTNNINLINIL
jgi:hypothetical protein